MSHKIEYVEPEDRPIKSVVIQGKQPDGPNALMIDLDEKDGLRMRFSNNYRSTSPFRSLLGIYPSRGDVDAMIVALETFRNKAWT